MILIGPLKQNLLAVTGLFTKEKWKQMGRMDVLTGLRQKYLRIPIMLI